MVRLTITICLLLALVAVASAATYEGQQVIRFHLKDGNDARRVFSFVDQHGLDIWRENKAKGEIDVRFSTISLSEVAQALSGLSYTIIVDDVQALVADTASKSDAARRNWLLKASGPSDSGLDFFQAYHTYAEIVTWMNQMAASYPNLAKVQQIGTTVEGNAILGIRIHSTKGPETKPLIVYNSLQHAREWISGATTTYVINTLLDGYGKSKTVTQIVDSLDWFIVPVVNVDGYQWTWNPSGDRLWRKNRRPVTSSCFGIDTNRNWGFHFKADPIGQACQETYAGATGFSEPENTAIARYLQNNPHTVGYIDFHSYSQLMMWPWAWQAAPPPNNQLVVTLGNKMVEAIKSVHGTAYTGGQIYEVIYPAYGSSVDFALGVANVTLPYGIELRDTGEYGFELPPSEIIPNGQEIWEAVETMAKFILDNNVKR